MFKNTQIFLGKMLLCSRCEKEVSLCTCKEEIELQNRLDREKHKHLLDGTHTLAEILNIDKESPQLEGLVENSSIDSFIVEYLVWDFNKENRDGLVRSLHYQLSIGFDWAIMLSGEKNSYPFINDLVQKSSEKDLREVYDILVKGVDEKIKKPNEYLYYLNLKAYVEVLRIHEWMAVCAGVLSRHCIPKFKNTNFLGAKEVKKILENTENEFREIYSLEIIKFLNDIKTNGLTLDKAREYVADVAILKNKKRNELHKQLLNYGRLIEHSEQDVMEDIVFNYHNDGQNITVRKGLEEICVFAGVLLLNEHDYELGRICEGDLGMPEKPNPNGMNDVDVELAKLFYETKIRKINCAKEFLKKHLAGEERFKGDYCSHVRVDGSIEKNTEKEDFELLKQVRNDNEDLDIKIGFEPSHAAHGKVVYSLLLKVRTDSFYNSKYSEKRLAGFMKYLKQKFSDE